MWEASNLDKTIKKVAEILQTLQDIAVILFTCFA